MKYPNLLVITSVDFINNVGATENTLRSFLSSWNVDNLHLLVCKDFNADYTHDGNSIFTLGHDEISIASFLIQGNRTAKSNLGVQDQSKTGNSEKNFLKSIKSSIKTSLKDLYQLLPFRFDSKLKQWLDAFQPEVIYFCAASYRDFLLCQKIVERYRIPVIPHFLDDWPNIRISAHDGDSFYKKRFRNLFSSVLRHAPFGLCISELMAQTYANRYSKKFFPLMNSVASEACRSCNVPKKIKKYLYAGSLYLRRYESLITICDELASMEISDLEFNIYAPENQWAELSSKFDKYSFVHYGGFLTAKQLEHAISNTDIIVFVESFDKSVLEFSRLSLSTRVPEFLSSGKPILAMGPSEQGAIQYLDINNVAFVIKDFSDIKQVFMDLQDTDVVREKLENAKRLFLLNHTTQAQQARFYNWINDAIAHS